MSGSYVQCPACGKRALSIATRCPQCGHEFPAHTLPPAPPPSRPGPRLPLLAIAGVAALALVLVTTLVRHAGKAKPEEQPASAVVTQPDTGVAVDSSPATTGARRFARTWTNVRDRRSVTGDVVAVLLPGDTVLADSLSRGWYRVTLEGEVLGYVYRTTLVTAPPSDATPP
jgi:hypothetical protein